MISVAHALSKIIADLPVTSAEQVPLPDALGRVLAADVTARLTQPRVDVSAMDGYAVRHVDLEKIPAPLTVIGESAAGGCFSGSVGEAQSVRIFTGAPVPHGADTIIVQENTERDGDAVHVLHAAPPGHFIRKAGMDFTSQTVLLNAGRLISARDVGLAAAANVPWVMVRRKPTVAIIATGNEVVMPGETLGDNQIISSNSLMLAAYLKVLGAEPLDLGIARDEKDILSGLVQAARRVDLLVTIGGASVGDYDLVNQVLDQEGVDLGFYKVAMRPGKPLIFGYSGDTPVLGLPGNPVSVGVTSRVFLAPAIDTLLGRPATSAAPLTARLGTEVGANDQRQDYLRARLSRADDGQTQVTPFSKQDSAMLATFAEADCLIIRPPHAPAAGAGDRVPYLPLRSAHASL